MTNLPQKFDKTIDEVAVRLISRAEDPRGLKVPDLRPRLVSAIEKYLVSADPGIDHGDIMEFAESLHADDLCLILACERGDEQAWSDLVSNYDSTVKSAAFRFCGHREDAEDLAGSIWAELHGLRVDKSGKKKGKIAYYSGKGSLGGWLRAVTGQLAIDEYRKMKRLVQVEEDRQFDAMARDSAENAETRVVSTPKENPEDILSETEAQSDIFAALRSAIEDLEEEERLIIKLYYFDGLKLKQIADGFGYHEATASRKIGRVQKTLRRSVEDYLCERHGWVAEEVRRFLSDSAEKLGVDLEKLFSALILAVAVQDAAREAVLKLGNCC